MGQALEIERVKQIGGAIVSSVVQLIDMKHPGALPFFYRRLFRKV